MSNAPKASPANTRTPTPAPSRGEPPQYELTAQAYINDQLLEEGATVYYRGIPGPHMIPLNDAAREMVEKHPGAMQTIDPIRDLIEISPNSTVLQPVHNRS